MSTSQAQDTFMRVHSSIVAKLQLLTELADNHFNVNPDNVTWGNVGDIVDIRFKLGELIARIDSC